MSYPIFFLFQAEDGIRDLVRSRGLGDVYKRQKRCSATRPICSSTPGAPSTGWNLRSTSATSCCVTCLLYTSDAADERSSVDLGGRRIIKKKNITDRVDSATPTDSTLISAYSHFYSYHRGDEG